MHSLRNIILATMLSTTALTGCGPDPVEAQMPAPATPAPVIKRTPEEQKLHDYILSQMDASLADPTWQMRHQVGNGLFRKLKDHNDRQNIKRTDKESEAFNREADQIMRELDEHYKPVIDASQRFTDTLRRQLGIKPKIDVEFTANTVANAETTYFRGKKNLTLSITSTEFDMLTLPELKDTISHEVAGHVKREYVDAKGNLLPFDRAAAVRAGISDSAAEIQADGSAIAMTCNLDTATRAMAKEQASARGTPLRVFRDQFASDTLPGIININGHPNWVARIKAMQELVATVCHNGSAKG